MSEYESILDEFWKTFGKGLEMALATSMNDDVTIRTVSVVPVDGKLYFLTFDQSVKYRQIQHNPHVALCVGPTYIRGTARITESLTAPESKKSWDALLAAFPDSMAMFSKMPGAVIIEVLPISGGFGRVTTGGMFAIDFASKKAHKLHF